MAELDVILGVVKDIKEQLEEVDGKCSELLEFKAVHTEAHKALDARQAGFKKTLYGDDNGTGLTYKVEKLLQCKQTFKTAAERRSGFWLGVLRTLITAAIIGVTAWLLSVYQGQERPSRPPISQPGASRGPSLP